MSNDESVEEDWPLGEPPDWSWIEDQVDGAMGQGVLMAEWTIEEHASLMYSDLYLSATCTKNGEENEIEVMPLHGEFEAKWNWRSFILPSYEGEMECSATEVIAVLQRVERDILACGATF